MSATTGATADTAANIAASTATGTAGGVAGAAGAASAAGHRRGLLRRLLSPHNRLALLALALLIAACLMPPVSLDRKVYRVLVTFDITQSMGVADLRRDGVDLTRLDYAREAARDLVRELPCGSEVGWAIFTGFRVMTLLQPLEVCARYDALVASLDAIGAAMRFANSSEVGKGLFWALRSAAEIDTDIHVIFLSDGQEAPPLASGQTGLPAVGSEIRRPGLVVGVGGDTALPIPRVDREGRPRGNWKREDVVQRSGAGSAGSREELSRLDEAHLRELATQAGLSYVRLGSTGLADPLAEHGVARLERVPTDLRWLPAVLALVLLCGHVAWPGARPLHRLHRLHRGGRARGRRSATSASRDAPSPH